MGKRGGFSHQIEVGQLEVFWKRGACGKAQGQEDARCT